MASSSSLPIGTPLTNFDELPAELEALGLHIVATTGYGNCLFHALSDQVFGHQNKHEELREEVIEELRMNPDRYKPFVAMAKDTAPRRNPRRKAASAAQTTKVPTAPTPSEVDSNYEAYLETMAKTGNYGDHVELVAFATRFKVDIKVLRVTGSSLINCDGAPSETYTIVYHEYEHYSSVRVNASDPNKLPDVGSLALTPEELDSQAQRHAGAIILSPAISKIASSFSSSSKKEEKGEEESDDDKGTPTPVNKYEDELKDLIRSDFAQDLEIDDDNDTDIEDWTQGIPESSPSRHSAAGTPSKSASSSAEHVTLPAQDLPVGRTVKLKLPFTNGQQEQVILHLKVRVGSGTESGASDSLEEQMLQVRGQLDRIEHLLLQGKGRAVTPKGGSSKPPASPPPKRLGRAKGLKKAAAAAKAKGGKGKGKRAGRAALKPAPA